MQWLRPEDPDSTPTAAFKKVTKVSGEPTRPLPLSLPPANTTDRRYWWVRWRKAERALIATAVVAAVCVMMLTVSVSAWMIWQIWLLFRK